MITNAPAARKRPAWIQSLIDQSKGKHGFLSATLVLSLTHLTVRIVGFFWRVYLTRQLGSEGMGILEMTRPLFSILIALVTAGFPVVTTRLVAEALLRKDPNGAHLQLRTTLRLVLMISVTAAIVLAPAVPWIGTSLLGDARTLPALYAYLPCGILLGLSCSYDSFFMGHQNPLPAAGCELAEQAARITIAMTLFAALPALNVAQKIGVAAVATTLGELVGLLFVQSVYLRRKPKHILPGALPYKKTVHAAAPIAASRLVASLLQAAQATLVPHLLMAFGLSQSQALSAWGQLAGMAMPLLFLPMVFTSAMGTLLVPSMAALEGKARLERIKRATLAAFGFSALCAIAMYIAAPFLASILYKQPAVGDLLRKLVILMPFFGLSQTVTSMLSGLGRERVLFVNGLAANILSLALVFLLTPRLGLLGYILSSIIANGFLLALHFYQLRKTLAHA